MRQLYVYIPPRTVGVPNFGNVLHLGRLKGILLGDHNVNLKDSTLIGRSRRTRNGTEQVTQVPFDNRVCLDSRGICL